MMRSNCTSLPLHVCVCLLLCFLFCDDHRLVGADERETRGGSGRRSGAA